MEGKRGRGRESRKKQSLGRKGREGGGMVKDGKDWRNAHFFHVGTAIPTYIP